MKDLKIGFDQWVSVNTISNVSKSLKYKKKKKNPTNLSCFSLTAIFVIKYIVTYCYPWDRIKCEDLFESSWIYVSSGWCFLDNSQ